MLRAGGCYTVSVLRASNRHPTFCEGPRWRSTRFWDQAYTEVLALFGQTDPDYT